MSLEERWKGGEKRRRGGKECEEEGWRAEKSRGVKEMGEVRRRGRGGEEREGRVRGDEERKRG